MGDNDSRSTSKDGRYDFLMEGYEFAPAAHSGGTSYGLEIIRTETGERLFDLSVARWDVGGPSEIGDGIIQTTVRSFPSPGGASSHVILALDLDRRRFCVVPAPYPTIWRTKVDPATAAWRDDWDAIESAVHAGIAEKEANETARKAAEPGPPVLPAPPAVPHDDYDTNALIELKRSSGKTAGIVGLDPDIDQQSAHETRLGQSDLSLARVPDRENGSGFVQELRDTATGTVLFTFPGGNWLVRDAAPNDPGVLALTPLEASPAICILIDPVKRFCAIPGKYWQEFDFLDSCWAVTDEHRSNMPLRRGKTVPVRVGMPKGAEGNGYFELPPPSRGVRMWEYRYGVAAGTPLYRQSIHLVDSGQVMENLPIGEWKPGPAGSNGALRFTLGPGTAYPDILVNQATGEAALDVSPGPAWTDARRIPHRLEDYLAKGGLESGQVAPPASSASQPVSASLAQSTAPAVQSGAGQIVVRILIWSGIGCLSIFLLLLLIGWLAS